MAIKGLHKLEVTRWKFPAGETGFRVADERAAYADFFNIKFDYADDSSLFELALVVDALRVDAVDGVLQLTDQVTKEEAAGGVLRTVFLDGKITVDEDYATIRRRLGYIA